MFCYENAIRVDQNNKDTWLKKGNVLFELKDYNNALLYYKKAVSADPVSNQNIFTEKGEYLFK